MLRGLKLFHVAGLVLFLGSIFTFIIISGLIEGASLENIAFGRKIISTGTNALTLPGLVVFAVTGVWRGYLRYGSKHPFYQLMLLLIMLVVINSFFFVLPVVTSATEIAVHSLAQGHLLPEYKAVYMQETISGSINIVLTMAAAVIGLW